MKIKLSKFNWINIYVIVGVSLTFVILFFYSNLYLYFYFKEENVESWLIMIFLIIVYVLSTGCGIFSIRNYLMIMEIDGAKIRSFLFRRLKCEVDTEKEMYYALFVCKETNTHLENYIAISNEWFICDEKKPTMWKRNTFIERFDTTKLIVFPYNKKTEHLFTIEKWIDVTK